MSSSHPHQLSDEQGNRATCNSLRVVTTTICDLLQMYPEQIEALECENRRLLEDKIVLNTRLSSAEKEKEEFVAKIDSEQEAILVLKQTEQRLTCALEASSTLNAKLKEENEMKDKEIGKLNSDMKKKKEELSVMATIANDLNMWIKDWKKMMTKLEKDTENLQTQLNVLQDISTQRETDDGRSVQKLEQQVTELKKSLEERDGEIRRVENERDILVNEKTLLTKAKDELEKEKNGQIDLLHSEIEAMRQTNDDLTKKLEKDHELHNHFVRENERLQRIVLEYSVYKEQVSAVKSVLESSKTDTLLHKKSEGDMGKNIPEPSSAGTSAGKRKAPEGGSKVSYAKLAKMGSEAVSSANNQDTLPVSHGVEVTETQTTVDLR